MGAQLNNQLNSQPNYPLRTISITGTGMYAPDRVVKNSYFDELYKKDIGTFLQSSRNISERRWMEPTQTTSDMIVPAAEEAMKNAGITAKDLDLIIVATDTPDYMSPSTASVVSHKLQALKAGTFDINTACAGFVTALEVGQKMMKTDTQFKYVLVVGAYAMSKWLNFDDYKIASLFADGAGAAILTDAPVGTHGFLASTFYTDAQYHDYMGIYAGGSYKPVTHEVLEKKEHLLSFPKRIPPETNGIHWPRLTHIILDKIKKRPEDIDHFFMTQFNVQSIYETLDTLKLPRDKAHYVMDRFGYTGSASIGMCMADAARAHKVKKGDLVLMLGSGGGMSMVAIAMEWGFNT